MLQSGMHAPLPDLGRRRWLHRSAQVALATCTLAALAPARAGYNIWLGEYTIERQLLQQGLAERCLLYTSPSPRDKRQSRMPSSA